jgi:hypothetical protein
MGGKSEGLLRAYNKEVHDDGKVGFRESNILIGHTRKATIGMQGAENMHPFVIKGSRTKLVGAHNGTLDFWRSLARDFDIDPTKENITVDSKVLYTALANNEIKDVMPKVEGSFALIWTELDGKLYVLKNDERPLFRGWIKDQEEKEMYISSIAESLEVIGCDEKDIKEFKSGRLYIIENGKILSYNKVPLYVKKYSVITKHTTPDEDNYVWPPNNAQRRTTYNGSAADKLSSNPNFKQLQFAIAQAENKFKKDMDEKDSKVESKKEEKDLPKESYSNDPPVDEVFGKADEDWTNKATEYANDPSTFAADVNTTTSELDAIAGSLKKLLTEIRSGEINPALDSNQIINDLEDNINNLDSCIYDLYYNATCICPELNEAENE